MIAVNIIAADAALLDGKIKMSKCTTVVVKTNFLKIINVEQKGSRTLMISFGVSTVNSWVSFDSVLLL